MIFTLTSIVNDPDIEAVMALLKRLLILQVESAKDLPAATSSSLLTSWRDYIDELGELIDPWHMRQLIDFVLYPQEVTSQVLENSDFIAVPPNVETFISNFLLAASKDDELSIQSYQILCALAAFSVPEFGHRYNAGVASTFLSEDDLDEELRLKALVSHRTLEEHTGFNELEVIQSLGLLEKQGYVKTLEDDCYEIGLWTNNVIFIHPGNGTNQ
jgi:hypothetical protein